MPAPIIDSRSALPITAVVVTFNEAGYLKPCLEAIAFCEQVLVMDLGSTDESVAIAQRMGAQVIPHARVEIVEQARADALLYANHDWLLTIDPDEVAPPQLPDLIRQVWAQNPQAGLVRAPRRFYFRGRPLTTTVWGRSNPGRPLLIHRRRAEFNDRVHSGYQLLPGYTEARIPFQPDNALKHFWADDYAQLFAKHRRYLAHEGRARYAAGARFSWFGLISRSLWDLKRNLFDFRGLLGGPDGWFLSLFHAWYVAGGWLALRAYQRALPPLPDREMQAHG